MQFEIDQANEKARNSESRYRQLRIEYESIKSDLRYDHLKRQIEYSPKPQNRFEHYSRPTVSTMAPNTEVVHTSNYKNSNRDDRFVIKSDPIVDYNEIISDKLYQKNMKSSIGELLRWDSTAGKNMQKAFYNTQQIPQRGPSNRSISQPPNRNQEMYEIAY